MMNQPRTRKAPATGASGRPRPFTKTLGETPKATKEPHKTQQELRSKHKIPNNVRCGVENALVGLCDVWFEEIKPYLLRNNIKLHVEAGGSERADEAEAGGDRGRMPPGAPGCSHLDPGAAPDRRRRHNANSVSCSSTQQATLRAQSRKQRQPPFKLQVPQPSLTATTVSKNQRNYEEQVLSISKVQADRQRRRGGCPSSAHKPRLCRTFSTPSPLPAHKHSTIVEEPSHKARFRRPILEERMVHQTTRRDQSTQTDPPLRHNSPQRRTAEKRPRRGSSPKAKAKSPVRREKSPIEWKKFPAQSQKSPAPIVKQKSRSPQRQQQCARKRVQSPPAQVPSRHRPASTYSRSSPAPHVSDSQHDPLCQDGLFDSIGASNDMDVQILYQTPRREENSAKMKHFLSIYKNEKVKKTLPWR